MKPDKVIPRLPVATIVEHDVPCRKCAYNLRSLPVDGRCPECGAAVGLSIQGDLLRFSDPAWVERLRLGLSLIVASIALAILLMALAIGLVFCTMGTGTSFRLFVNVGSFFISAFYFVGTWLLTSPDPSGVGEDQYGTARRLIRAALAIGVCDIAAQYIPDEMAYAAPARAAVVGIHVLTSVARIVTVFITLNYLGKLALRIPDADLSARARSLTWTFGCGHALLVGFALFEYVDRTFGLSSPARGRGNGYTCAYIVGVLAVVVFGIVYVVLLNRLRRRFAEQAALARQTWAAGGDAGLAN